VENEGGKFNLAIIFGSRSRRGLPDLQASSHANSEVTSRGRELERRNSGFEGEVVDGNAPLEVGQNAAAIFIDGQEKVTPRRKVETVDVCTVRERQGIRSVSMRQWLADWI
jgi:hypothetical protein